MKWISVKDKLPGEFPNNFIIGWIKLAGGWAARTGFVNNDGKFYRSPYKYSDEMTHWMPLPEPPTEEE